MSSVTGTQGTQADESEVQGPRQEQSEPFIGGAFLSPFGLSRTAAGEKVVF